MAIITIQGFAQTERNYKGRVSNNMESLIGVQFINSSTYKVVAISDANGVFNFNSSSETVIARFIGYQDKLIKSNHKEQLIVLNESEDLLNTIVVTENKRATLLKNSTVSLDVIKPDLLKSISPTNIEDGIGRINGVQVVDNQPNIRGGSGWSYGAGSRVQVMINDMPILSGDAGQPLWNFIPTEGIDGVEIVKGASSVIYGSSALSGVINIKTKKPGNHPFTQMTLSSGVYSKPKRESLSYKQGKRNSISNLTLYHTSKIKTVDLILGVNALDDESYKMSDYDKRVRTNIGLRKVFTDKNLIVGVNSTMQKGRSASFLLWKSYEQADISLDSGLTKSNSTRVSIDPYILWKSRRVNHSFNSRYLLVDNDIDNGDSTSNQSNKSDLIYLEYKAKYSNIKKNFNAVAGLVALNTITKSPLFSGNQSAANYASYLQLDKKWYKFLFSGGVRYEHFTLNERNEGKPVFRSGLNYEVAKATFARASFGQGYRFPSIAESFITTTVGPVSVFPNDNLKSETSTNLELGLKQGFKIKTIKGLIDVAFYQMNFNNMMEFTFGQWGDIVPPLYGAGFKTINTGKTQVKGFETTISLQQKFKDVDIQGFVGYTLSNSKALEPDSIVAVDVGGTELTFNNTSSNNVNSVLKYRPRHMVKADVIIKFKNLILGGGLSYQSQMENIDNAFVSAPISIFIPGIQESYNKKLTQFILGNARASYTINDNWNIALIVTNLGNREYAIRPADLGAPRLVRFQILYTLGKTD